MQRHSFCCISDLFRPDCLILYTFLDWEILGLLNFLLVTLSSIFWSGFFHFIGLSFLFINWSLCDEFAKIVTFYFHGLIMRRVSTTIFVSPGRGMFLIWSRMKLKLLFFCAMKVLAFWWTSDSDGWFASTHSGEDLHSICSFRENLFYIIGFVANGFANLFDFWSVIIRIDS